MRADSVLRSKTRSSLVTQEWESDSKGTSLSPQALSVSTNPNDFLNLEAVRRARTAIIVDGGMVGNLAHIAGTKLGEELRNAYLKGVTIYASSEGTNALGVVNASLLWPKNMGGSDQHIPTFTKGFGIVPFGVSSHVDGPRLIAKYAGCGTVTTMPLKNRRGNYSYRGSVRSF